MQTRESLYTSGTVRREPERDASAWRYGLNRSHGKREQPVRRSTNNGRDLFWLEIVVLRTGTDPCGHRSSKTPPAIGPADMSVVGGRF
jgi:hypothetical protein